jgi:hypothetical protein
MPELRSGARQPRSPPVVQAAVAACPETVPTRRTTPRRRAAIALEEACLKRNRVRTRAAVAKEAAVVNRVAGRAKGTGSGRPTKQNRNSKAPPPQPRAGPGPRQRGPGRGKQVSPRSRFPEPQPLQDPSPFPEENVEADIDLEDDRQAEAAEVRAMEEESAGRSAEKVPGAEDDGSAAPLPERVNCLLGFCTSFWVVIAASVALSFVSACGKRYHWLWNAV